MSGEKYACREKHFPGQNRRMVKQTKRNDFYHCKLVHLQSNLTCKYIDRIHLCCYKKR